MTHLHSGIWAWLRWRHILHSPGAMIEPGRRAGLKLCDHQRQRLPLLLILCLHSAMSVLWRVKLCRDMGFMRLTSSLLHHVSSGTDILPESLSSPCKRYQKVVRGQGMAYVECFPGCIEYPVILASVCQ